ncbi:type VII secretion protein EsaA [Shouchella patagoniensis]|uniref:type VII secretion protein EsaA n=1 Tax=Shouchella patagoniensis TaxID=228576 RepID=UPI000995284B|nr:type VII secretion protein EsaA [Shouchella patagoniensis]
MEKRHTVKLVLLVVLILAVPVLFYEYIGQEPMREEKQASGKLAIVNEDNGYQYEENESLLLGQDIVLTLQNDSEYDWDVTSRSAAQAGLERRDYDAIVYIESSFSENVMSFQDMIPNRAAVQYEIYNNLNAENQERVQKELESAQLKMNQQISTQYWRYVSEEVDRVRDNFQEVLQKEEDFLVEMYDFYAPSSEQLAGEIEQQRERLSNLFANSSEATDSAERSAQTLEEAQENFEVLSEAINMYMTYQDEQTELMLTAHSENELLMNEAQLAYQSALQEGTSTIQELQTPFAPELVNDGSEVESLFQGWAISAYMFGNVMDQFNQEMEQHYARSNEAINGLPEAQADLIGLYATEEQDKQFNKQLKDLKEARWSLTEEEDGPDNPENPRPEPIEEEWESVDGEQLLAEVKSTLGQIRNLVYELNPDNQPEDENDNEGGDEPPGDEPEVTPPGETPDPEESETSPPDNGNGNPGDGDEGESELEPEEPSVDEPEEEPTPEEGEESNENEEQADSIDDLAFFPPFQVQLVTNSITELQLIWQEAISLLEKLQDEEPLSPMDLIETEIDDSNEYIERLLAYVEELEAYTQDLEEELGEVTPSLVQTIIDAENELFNELGWRPTVANEPIVVSDSRQLMNYFGELSKFELTIAQNGQINENRIRRLIASDNQVEKVQEQVNRSIASINGFMENRSDIEGAGQTGEAAEKEFNAFLADTTSVLSELEQEITEEQQAIREQSLAIAETVETIGSSISSDWNSLEVGQPPVEDLNGQMVVSNQQTSLGEIQQLGSSVQTLEEQQGDVITRTDEMFGSIESVQAQSDDLNNRWSSNVDNTEVVYQDIQTILENALSDGHHNDYVYHHLSSPVQVSGEQAEGPVKQTTPPIVVLVILLLTSLLIGFLTHQYSSVPISINLALFGILSIIVGLVISIYGLTIYTVSGSQAIEWTIITVLLVIVSSGLVRTAFMAGPWVGWLLSVALILFYTSPLLDMAMPNFSSSNPVAELYISLQAGSQNAFMTGFIPLLLLALAVIAVPLIQHFVVNGKKKQEDEYEM